MIDDVRIGTINTKNISNPKNNTVYPQVFLLLCLIFGSGFSFKGYKGARKLGKECQVCLFMIGL